MRCLAQGSSGCVSGDCENGYGTYIWSYDSEWAGDRYAGYWKNGYMHGFGTYSYSSGAKYIGEHKLGKRHGEGTFIWVDGDRYVGDWQNGNQHGYGVFFYATGEAKVGYWENGKFQYEATGCVSGDCNNGYGTYLWSNGEKYTGNWQNNSRNGEGTNYFASGNTYIGDWTDDKRNGYGKEYYNDGTSKTGFWKNDRFLGNTGEEHKTGCISGDCNNGYGTYVWDSGDKYVGYWKDNYFSGYGTYYFATDEWYEGHWENNKRNGYGVNYYADNSRKEGFWKDDIFYGTNPPKSGCISGNCTNGYGVYVFNSGNRYEGNWKNDDYHGQGTFIFANGGRYVGEFKDSKYNGKGTFFYTDGTKKEGFWQDNDYMGSDYKNSGCISGNCENGFGTYLFETGDKYVGGFKNGNYSGDGTYYFASSGNKYVGEWENNKYNGKGTLYYADGTSKTGIWKDNEYAGPIINEGKPPAITWIYPKYYSSTSKTATFTVKACIESSDEITSTQILVNGAMQINDATRGFNVVSTECDYTLEKPVTLSNGENKIQIIVENKNGKTSSDLRTITFDGGTTIKQSRYALVIGNANYKSSPLRNPVNDAKAIGKILRELGFDVMLYTDISQNDMKRSIREFGRKLAQDQGVGLFYFAGHGLQLNGQNFLVPVDAYIEKEQDVELETVNLKRVLGEMEYARNDMNIIILDACRNNPFARSFRSTTQNGLATTTAPSGTFIAYATAPGSVAADGTGENGLYTEELLKALKKPGLRIEDVFKQVRVNVYNRSNKQQIPWENSSIFGDFYFKK